MLTISRCHHCAHTVQMTVTETETTQSPATTMGRVRYLGIDLARFVAIAGMMAAHLVAIKALMPDTAEPEQSISIAVSLATNGTAAALFAVLGGVSIVFATRSKLRTGQRLQASLSIAVRGVVLLLLGVLLGFVDNGIIVILAFYGVAMILVAPLISLPSWLLASIATVLGLASGWVNIAVRRALGITMDGPHFTLEFLVSDPLVALRALFLTGEYPAVTWLTCLIVGILVGRLLTTATAQGNLGKTSARLAIIGAVIFVVAQLTSNWIIDNLRTFGVLKAGTVDEARMQLLHMGGSGAPASLHPLGQLIAVPHSGSVMDLIRTFGLSFAVIGLLVFLFDRESVRAITQPRRPGFGSKLLGAIRAAGAAPLTIYTLHILVSGLLQSPTFGSGSQLPSGSEIPWWAGGPAIYLLQLAGVIAIGAILSASGRRGPLEALLARIVSLVAPRRSSSQS